MIYTTSHLQLSNKLGWGEMSAEIAIPAMDKMLQNFNFCMEEAGCREFTFEDFVCLVCDWQNMPADEIFKYLYVDEICKEDTEDCYLFISLRGEIEEYMSRGYSHQDAIDEWFK